jgi:hypothetical protein
VDGELSADLLAALSDTVWAAGGSPFTITVRGLHPITLPPLNSAVVFGAGGNEFSSSNMNDIQRRRVEETQYREERSKASWAVQHAEAEAGRVTAFHLDDMKHQRLHKLKEQVAGWAIGWSRAAAHTRISRLVRWHAVASRGAPFTRDHRSHISALPHSFSGV